MTDFELRPGWTTTRPPEDIEDALRREAQARASELNFDGDFRPEDTLAWKAAEKIKALRGERDSAENRWKLAMRRLQERYGDNLAVHKADIEALLENLHEQGTQASLPPETTAGAGVPEKSEGETGAQAQDGADGERPCEAPSQSAVPQMCGCSGWCFFYPGEHHVNCKCESEWHGFRVPSQMNTDDEIRQRMTEVLKQAKFDNAMDHERLLNCIRDLCDATNEQDWEAATASAISSVSRLDTCERTLKQSISDHEHADKIHAENDLLVRRLDASELALHQLREDHSHCEDSLNRLGTLAAERLVKIEQVEAERDEAVRRLDEATKRITELERPSKEFCSRDHVWRASAFNEYSIPYWVCVRCGKTERKTDDEWYAQVRTAAPSAPSEDDALADGARPRREVLYLNPACAAQQSQQRLFR